MNCQNGAIKKVGSAIPWVGFGRYKMYFKNMGDHNMGDVGGYGGDMEGYGAHIPPYPSHIRPYPPILLSPI